MRQPLACSAQMQNDIDELPKPRFSYWRFQALVWGFQGFETLAFAFNTPPMRQWWLILLETARMGLVALISHGIAKIAISRRWFSLKKSALIARALISCAIGGFASAALFAPISSTAYSEYFDSNTILFFFDWLNSFTMLTVWGALFFAFHLYDQNRRLELDRIRIIAASKEAQLAALKSQLNPHFLFNSFNLLRALVQREPEAARDLITHLAEMMRYSLTSASCDTVCLARELEFVESYLTLERRRFENRLRISAQIPEEFRNQKIPSMLLYTLVENAVKYGIDQDCSGVDITYSIERDANNLVLRVVNSGRLAKSGSSTGTGLANIGNRLKLLYGKEASIHISERANLVTAEAKWPFTNSPEIT